MLLGLAKPLQESRRIRCQPSCQPFRQNALCYRELYGKEFQNRQLPQEPAEASVCVHETHLEDGQGTNIWTSSQHAPGKRLDETILIFVALSRDSRRLEDRKSTRLNSSHVAISYSVFFL